MGKEPRDGQILCDFASMPPCRHFVCVLSFNQTVHLALAAVAVLLDWLKALNVCSMPLELTQGPGSRADHIFRN
jgi:hypothetical protein